MNSSRIIATPVMEAAIDAAGAREVLRVPAYDVRLRREIAHRRFAISLGRRVMRVLTLHLLDAAIVASVLTGLALALDLEETAMPLLPAVVVTFLLSLNAVAAFDAGIGRRDERRLVSACLLAGLLLAGLSAFPPHLPFSAEFLAGLTAASFAALAVGRTLADRLVRVAYARGLGLRKAVLIGSLEEVADALRRLRDENNPDQYVVGHLSIDADDPAALGTVRDLSRVIDESEVEEVLVATPLTVAAMRGVTAACFERGAAVYVLPSVMSPVECWADPTNVNGCPVIRLHPPRLELPALMIKRMVDVVAAVLALVLLAPVIALLALAIKLDSPGPVFFRQTRIGLGGRPFTIWKFRSMATDAEQRLRDLEHLNIYGGRGPFKLTNDPRITRVGAWLRRTSMDELPQLFNVLTGEMSLVGPRPLPPSDLARMEPADHQRLSVVPGVTGPWQVNGRNLITDFEKIAKMERDYIAHWSLLLDVKILFRTVGVVIRGDGAY